MNIDRKIVLDSPYSWNSLDMTAILRFSYLNHKRKYKIRLNLPIDNKFVMDNKSKKFNRARNNEDCRIL